MKLRFIFKCFATSLLLASLAHPALHDGFPARRGVAPQSSTGQNLESRAKSALSITAGMLQLIIGPLAPDVFVERPQGPVGIIGVKPAGPLLELGGDFVIGMAQHTFPARREIDDVAADVPVPDAVF